MSKMDFTKKVIDLDEYRRFREAKTKRAIRQIDKDMVIKSYWRTLATEWKAYTELFQNPEVSDETEDTIIDYFVQLSAIADSQGSDSCPDYDGSA